MCSLRNGILEGQGGESAWPRAPSGEPPRKAGYSTQGRTPSDSLSGGGSGCAIRELKQRDRAGQEFHRAGVWEVVGEPHVGWPRALSLHFLGGPWGAQSPVTWNACPEPLKHPRFWAQGCGFI